MSKSPWFIVIGGICLVGLCLILAAAIVTGGNAGDGHMNAINKTLIGTNLTYYSIAGKPMNYTIEAGDIRSIEKVEYNGRPAWKVRVGQGLSWDLVLDAEGRQILETTQLFNT